MIEQDAKRKTLKTDRNQVNAFYTRCFWFLTCTWGPWAFQDLPETPSSSLCRIKYCLGFLEAHPPVKWKKKNPDIHQKAGLRLWISISNATAELCDCAYNFIPGREAEYSASLCPPLHRPGWCAESVSSTPPGSLKTCPPARPETWWPASWLSRNSDRRDCSEYVFNALHCL